MRPTGATDYRPEAAEALGTFALVFAGCGAIAAGASSLGASLAFAFVIVAFVVALAPICGAHFNPAITLAFAATGHFPWKRAASYVAAQVAGALAAAALLRVLLGPAAELGLTALRPGLGVAEGFVVELAATFFLGFVIVAVATDPRTERGAAGLAIGLTVGLDALAFGSLTGASMNPARSLGPALVTGAFADLWLYLLAPAAGAVLAMRLFAWLRPGRAPRGDGKAYGVAGPVDVSPAEAAE